MMNAKRSAGLLCAVVALAFVLTSGSAVGQLFPAINQNLVPDLANILVKFAETTKAPCTITKQVVTLQWVWIECLYSDDTYPLTIDLVISTQEAPLKVLYMLPGSALNFQSDFFTPINSNVAHFMREHGYLIVGITPRENNVPTTLTQSAYSFMQNWGLAQHKHDIRTIIEQVQSVVPLPSDVLGHSAGSLYALDYAATFSGVGKIMLLDMVGTYNPVTEAQFVKNSQATYNAYVTLLQKGQFANMSFDQFRKLVTLAEQVPNADSGVPRTPFGGPAGDFTLAGLMFWSFIHTNTLPGPTTLYTGLPDNWFYVQGFLNGVYTFNPDPTLDVHYLTVSPLNVVEAAVAALGSAFYPNAARRDTFAVFAHNGTYSIDWANIKEKVVWVNAALGFGNHSYAAQLIQQGGNQHVTFTVVPNYGHADVTYGTNAAQNVWPLLLQ